MANIAKAQHKTLKVSGLKGASCQRTNVSGEAESAQANHSPHSDAGEVNPLARIAGSYADDPNWPEFIQAMETSRRELDETAGSV